MRVKLASVTVCLVLSSAHKCKADLTTKGPVKALPCVQLRKIVQGVWVIDRLGGALFGLKPCRVLFFMHCKNLAVL